MTTIYERQNKYIRLRIVKVGCTYRADISINKYAYDKNTHRYYEINFDVFSPYDYASEEETFENAKKWLYDELKLLQEGIDLGGENENK